MNGGYWGATKPPAGVALDRAAPLAQGLRALWPVNEGAGALLTDVVGGTTALWNGTTTNMRWEGSPWGAAFFNNSPSTQLLNAGTRRDLRGVFPMTVAAWVRPNSLSYATAALVGHSQSASGWGFCINSASLSFVKYGVVAINATSTYFPNTTAYRLVVAVVTTTGVRFLSFAPGGGLLVSETVANSQAFGSPSNDTVLLLGGIGGLGTGTQGALAAAAVWPGRALDDATCASLAAAPGQLFAPPVWRRYVIGGGSLTPVGQTVDTTWAVRAAVGQPQASTWGVRAAVAQTKQAAWNVAAAVAQTVPATWAVRALASQAVQASWHVATAIGQTVQGTWAVRVAVAQTQQATWAVRQAVGQIIQASWNVRAAVAQTVAATWHVTVAVGQAVVSTWAVRQAVGQVLDATWNVAGVLTSVGQTVASTWAVRAAVGQTASATWAVRQAIGRALAATWRVLSTALPLGPARPTAPTRAVLRATQTAATLSGTQTTAVLEERA